MRLTEIIKLQRQVSESLDELCERPRAKSQSEVELWERDYKEYLKAKSLHVNAIPNELLDDISILTVGSKTFYHSVIEGWHKYSFKNFKMFELMSMQKKGEITPNEMRALYKDFESKEYATIEIQEKISDFFLVFDKIIDAINTNTKDWFDWYKAGGIRGDGLVWNISSLDIFAWQLPAGDPKNKKEYFELAKLMTIFFLIEQLYKNDSLLNNDINPLEKLDLHKILAYYNVSK